MSPDIGKARQGKANLFIEHNSYTRQFKVLYSYIKSEDGKKNHSINIKNNH